jgi:hypothetical protein
VLVHVLALVQGFLGGEGFSGVAPEVAWESAVKVEVQLTRRLAY